jgi:hypothetical protein
MLSPLFPKKGICEFLFEVASDFVICEVQNWRFMYNSVEKSCQYVSYDSEYKGYGCGILGYGKSLQLDVGQLNQIY